jgi:two-component system sensor kinase FixL
VTTADDGPAVAASDLHWTGARRALAKYEAEAKRMRPAQLAGVAALAASALLLILTLVLASTTLSRLDASFNSLLHSETVLQELARAKEGLLESSTATRSFVISGDAAYIAAYRSARRDMKDAFESVVGLVGGNSLQERQAIRLDALLTARLRWFDSQGGLTLARRDAIAREMRSPAQGPAFKSFLVTVRGALDSMRAAEFRLMAARRRQEEAEQADLLWACGAAAVLSLASGLFGTLLIQRERGERRAREIQLELMHAQRLDLVNQSSAMLAHELSQPLTAAANYLAALKRLSDNGETKLPDKLADLAMRARLQILRASGIVARLHRFIDKRVAERSPQALATLVEDAVSLLGTLDESIALSIFIEPDLAAVAIDRVQVQQVLVNLMRNAIEAMHGNARSTLSLSVRAAGTDSVLFSLKDNGPGLPKEIAGRLFQPFVTSKKDGLGVGLSICRTIIADHGGRIWAESKAGSGTTFHFTLPTVPLALAA